MDTGHHALLEHPRRRQAKPYSYPLEATRPRRIRPLVNAKRAARRARGPAWMALYALLPLAALLCAFAEYVSPNGGWRRLAEGLVAFVVIGVAWLWVRVNRSALSRMRSDPESGTVMHDLRVEIQEGPPQVIPLEARRSRSTR